MSKKSLAVAGLLFASSFALGVAFLAPSSKPASAAPAVAQPVPAPEPAPVVVEMSAVLVLAEPVREAPKPRPVAARPRPAKQWVCGEPETLLAGHKARAANPSTVRTCGWR